MIEHSEKFEQMPKAFLEAQKKITAVIRTKTADLKFQTKSGSTVTQKMAYADLAAVIEAIKEPLNEAKISFMQYTNGGDLETMLLHESGEYIAMKMPVLFQKEKDPQAFGSGLTYAKRYSLQTILGLPSEDDDGKAAANPAETKAEQKLKTDDSLPNAKAQAVIDAVHDKLLDSTPDGMKLNKDKIGKAIYVSKKGAYVEEIEKVGTVANFLAKQIKNLCDVAEVVNA